MDKQFAIVRKDLARNVRARRKELGLSQEQLAFETSLDRTYVSQIERGLANPSLQVLSRMGTALGLSVQQLLSRPG